LTPLDKKSPKIDLYIIRTSLLSEPLYYPKFFGSVQSDYKKG